MGRREDAAKLRKKYRRGRYARFSGATSRFAVRIEQRLLREGDIGEDGKPVRFGSPEEQETKVRIKDVEIYIGKVSLTRQVVNGGKSSVNSERMETYFERANQLHKKPLSIAEIFGVNNSKYQQVWEETSPEHRINFYSNELGRLDMYYCEGRSFFVEIDLYEKTIKRSREYGSVQRAKDAELHDNIQWVESIPLK